MTEALAALTLRTLMKYPAAAFGAAAVVPALRPLGVAAVPAKASEQAAEFITYGIPDDWANYGEVFTSFQTNLGVTTGKHPDTDMSSLEEIAKFGAQSIADTWDEEVLGCWSRGGAPRHDMHDTCLHPALSANGPPQWVVEVNG